MDFHATARKNTEMLQPETAAALQKCDFTSFELSILLSEMSLIIYRIILILVQHYSSVTDKLSILREDFIHWSTGVLYTGT